MASPVIADLIAAADKIESVAESAITVINGIAARIQAAVDAALANGATAEELKPVQDEVDQLNASADALSAAIANVP